MKEHGGSGNGLTTARDTLSDMRHASRRVLSPMRKMTLRERIDNYHKVTGFPESLFLGGDGRLNGVWVMGNNYQVKSSYYGGYPHGYLQRVKALFPEKQKTLHLFSGQVGKDVFDGVTVDINPKNQPDIVGDAHELPDTLHDQFDLVLADPPYSVEDCDHYGTVMVRRNKVLASAVKVLRKGGHIVWLDQVLPMYRKTELRTVGYIGMVKSTNHRFRVITIFEKVIDV